ncbi:SDR family oxidoreductase [Dankookia rubra]|uniref:SDR family oxidoreductase n=1 Tax=Dankookia rubra TaxID=1442381 RepID=UPI0019D5A292|nr:SDR family oxidoreductase [Dankookia rubra]
MIVTGGASGIGRATTLRLAEEGCIVGVLDLNEAGARETAAMAPSGAVHVYPTDITDYAAVEHAVSGFEAAHGPTELLANIAGWDLPKPFLDTTLDFWDKVIRINLYGPLHLQHIVLRGMAARGFGRVVNVASDAGRVGSSGEAVYSACKGGVIAFTKTMARELARQGITLNVLCPGPTDTPLFAQFSASAGTKLGEALTKAIPLRRLGRPEDYPGTIAFLLSDDAGFMTGQTISISGGLTMS